MIPKKTNPVLPTRPLTRIKFTSRLVEGEDFTVACPEWCDRIPDGDVPSAEGWYLVVCHFWGTEERTAQLDVVYVCHAYDHSRFIAHEICSDKVAELTDFWWVGKIRMSACINLRGAHD